MGVLEDRAISFGGVERIDLATSRRTSPGRGQPPTGKELSSAIPGVIEYQSASFGSSQARVSGRRYGIETIGILDSVSHGEDTPESDLDVISSSRPEMDTHENQPDPEDFLETSFRESRSGLCRTDEQEVPCKRDDGGCGALISSK